MNQETLEIIQRIANKLAIRYRFDINDEDDIKQEIFIICMKAMPNFDASKASLENFLFVHVNNRLKTLIRDTYYTNNGSWIENRKKSVFTAGNIDTIDENNEHSVQFTRDESVDLDKKIIFNIIDKSLPASMRSDYLRIIHGISIPTSRKTKVVEAISSLLKENGYEKENWTIE